jgi:hypothetical protein
VTVTALKDFRADLTAHLAAGLDATAPALGKLVHPPAVVVQAGSPYVSAPDYSTDTLLFAATIVAGPGDLAAVADALDDLIDGVRATLKTASSQSVRYRFVEVSGFTTWPSGDELLPAVVVTVEAERLTPNA